MKIVITGGPGFGKTTIIDELRRRGYWAGRELFDEFILEQLNSSGQLLPWIDHNAFALAALPRKIDEYKNAKSSGTLFFDRGFVDYLGYCQLHNQPPLHEWVWAINNYRYDHIFIVPPWQGIWKQDAVRRETWDEAELLHKYILQAYRDNGYKPVEVPRLSVKERASFILDTLKPDPGSV